MLIAAVTHLGVTPDWALVDVGIATLLVTILLTVLGFWWRVRVARRKAAEAERIQRELDIEAEAKRAEKFDNLVLRLEKELGGNGGGLREAMNAVREDVSEIKHVVNYNAERFDRHIEQHARTT